jgi:hypothetical protein
MRALDTPCSILLQFHTKRTGRTFAPLYIGKTSFWWYFGIQGFENIGHFGILAI